MVSKSLSKFAKFSHLLSASYIIISNLSKFAKIQGAVAVFVTPKVLFLESLFGFASSCALVDGRRWCRDVGVFCQGTFVCKCKCWSLCVK